MCGIFAFVFVCLFLFVSSSFFPVSFLVCFFVCCGWLFFCFLFVLFFRSFFVIQIHKRLKRTPFIRTKYNMRILESNST